MNWRVKMTLQTGELNRAVIAAEEVGTKLKDDSTIAATTIGIMAANHYMVAHHNESFVKKVVGSTNEANAAIATQNVIPLSTANMRATVNGALATVVASTKFEDLKGAAPNDTPSNRIKPAGEVSSVKELTNTFDLY
jgi:hypothetical protein